MIELIFAAALAQGAAPPADPCNAGQPDPSRAGCPQWRSVRDDEQGKGYVDPASAHREGDTVEVMTRTVLPGPIEGGATSFNARIRFDCARRTRMIIYLTAFDAVGGTIMAGPISTDPPQPAPPDSPYAALMEEYCPRTG
jgi:hypothetical protein